MLQYEWLDEYLRARPGATVDFKIEWGWQRYQVGGKLFAAICKPDEIHREYGGHELLTLKCEPTLSELLRQEYPDILPGFYMDKRNWISVNLEGAVPDEVLQGLCSRSYELVFGKLTKKLRQELCGSHCALS